MSDKQRYQDFLIEAEDIVQGLNKNLRRLQTLPVPSDDVNPDIINALFRGMHSLKGISSLLGFTNIAALSHKLEDLLEHLRLGRLKLTTPIIDTLFEGVDVLVRLLTNINDRGGENLEIGPIAARIIETIQEQESSGKDYPGESPCLDGGLWNSLSDSEIHRLECHLKQGACIYRIAASFEMDTIHEGIAKLQERLACFGEVIGFIPASGFSAENGVAFEFVIASKDGSIEGNIDDLQKAIPARIEKIELFNSLPQNPAVTSTGPEEPTAKSITMTVRVGIDKLDTLLNNAGEIFLLSDTIFHATKDLKKRYGNDSQLTEVHKLSKGLLKRFSLLRDDLIGVRMVPVGPMFDRLLLAVDKLCRELSKDIKIEGSGYDTKLDKSMMEGIADPLMHIIRNAVDHGIEDGEARVAAGKPKTGTIWLRAYHRGSRVFIEIEDDGAGIDLNKIHAVALEKGFINKGDEAGERRLLECLFQPGFSTRGTINEISGRGIGLDIVAKNIANLGGMIDVETEMGKGTKFSIILPLTLLIAKALIVTECGNSFAIPFNSISENFILRNRDIRKIRGMKTFNVRGHCIPLVRLNDILKFSGERMDYEGSDDNERKYVVVVGLAEKRAGILVDGIEGQREILIKPLSKLLGGVPGIAGFTEIDSTRIIPVLDAGGVIAESRT